MFLVLFMFGSFFSADLKVARSYDGKKLAVLFNYFLKVKFFELKLLS